MASCGQLAPRRRSLRTSTSTATVAALRATASSSSRVRSRSVRRRRGFLVGASRGRRRRRWHSFSRCRTRRPARLNLVAPGVGPGLRFVYSEAGRLGALRDRGSMPAGTGPGVLTATAHDGLQLRCKWLARERLCDNWGCRRPREPEESCDWKGPLSDRSRCLQGSVTTGLVGTASVQLEGQLTGRRRGLPRPTPGGSGAAVGRSEC